MREGLRYVDADGLVGECPRVSLGDSRIYDAGKGIFANEHIDAGSNIAPITIGDDWTLAGRYTNHSHAPNSKAVATEDGVYLESIINIGHGEEITADYRQVKNVMEVAV